MTNDDLLHLSDPTFDERTLLAGDEEDVDEDDEDDDDEDDDDDDDDEDEDEDVADDE